jgi:hypothetical protein
VEYVEGKSFEGLTNPFHQIEYSMRFFFYLLLFLPLSVFSQKEIYIPNEWQQPNGLDYSYDRSSESGNFIIFWGPLAGDDPTQAPSDIAFDPQFILSTAEELYKFYIDTLQFVQDDEGLLSEYKIILVMLHTWTGLEGWAFGGNYDGTVGAMWMHPHAASSGPTFAHEFTHTLQNYAWMLNPGHGFIDNSYVGFFWEAHAEFMALQKYPSVALQFDMARWLNTCHFHWSSTRHHYQAFVFLQYIKEKDGISMINRMWNESNIGEHPLQTYKRLKGINQQALNDMFGEYAMRNVSWDYEIGDLLRERVSTLESKFISHPTYIPEAIDTSLGWYKIPNHLAPQDYGYNIIRLYPKEVQGCARRVVRVRLDGQTLLPGSEQAGWRFGLVAVNVNQQPRYSNLFSSGEEILFEMNNNESELYLVVSGAPQFHHNYAWEIGFPKIYRYPYDFRIENAWPEGFQPYYRDVDMSISGAPHINGGGFVAASAFADASAYVGPDAQVLGQAQVGGFARITDFAIVQDNAVVEGNATIADKAIIGENAHVYGNARVQEEAKVYGGCMIYGDAIIKGNTLIFFTSAYEQAQLKDNTFCWGATLYGDILLGGDAEFFRECSDGTYLQVEHAYDRNCDGLDDHPANENLTDGYISSYLNTLFSLVCDSLLENVFYDIDSIICEGDTLEYNGELLTQPGEYQNVYPAASGADSIVTLHLDVMAILIPIAVGTFCKGDTVYVYGYPITEPGPYTVFIDTLGCGVLVDVQLQHITADTSVLHLGSSLVALATSSLFQWYDCSSGQPIPGADQAEFVPLVNGSYQVQVTSSEGCEAFSQCYDITTVSTQSIPSSFSWNIQPNPAHDVLQLKLNSKSTDEILIELLDMTGQLVLIQPFSKLHQSETINLQALPPGSYVIKLTDAAGSVSSKIFSKI